MRANEIVRIVAAHLGEGEEAPIAAIPAAVPFFLVRLTTICVERRELGVLREFILRMIQIGISSSIEVASMLGVRPDDVAEEIQVLVDESFLFESEGTRKLALLEKGHSAISLIGLTRSVVRETGCYFDGVKRSVGPTPTELVPKRRLPSESLVLPAVPARPPRIDEIDVVGVKAAITSAKNPLPRVLEVTRLGRIIRTNILYSHAFVLLRRGPHSVPLICVDGASDMELAQILGSHPVLQLVKGSIEKHERAIRKILVQHIASLKGAKPANFSHVREALLQFVHYSDVAKEKIQAAEKDFIQAATRLFSETHWISAPEAQLLLAVALLTVKNHLTVLAPPLASSLFTLEVFEDIQLAIRRGVKVDLHVSANDERFLDSESPIRKILKGATFHKMPAVSGWCGFCMDNQTVVVAALKVATSSSGKNDAFVGAVIVNDIKGSQFLQSMAITSGAPVMIKPKRKAFSMKDEA